MKSRVTQLTVVPEGAAIFDERGFTVKIEDEAGGEFVEVCNNCEGGTLRLDPSDWPELRRAINRMVRECRE